VARGRLWGRNLALIGLALGLIAASCGKSNPTAPPPFSPESLLRAQVVASSLPLRGVVALPDLGAVAAFGEEVRVVGLNGDGTDFFTLTEGLRSPPLAVGYAAEERLMFVAEGTGRLVKFAVPPGRPQGEVVADEEGLASFTMLSSGLMLVSGLSGFLRSFTHDLEQHAEMELGTALSLMAPFPDRPRFLVGVSQDGRLMVIDLGELQVVQEEQLEEADVSALLPLSSRPLILLGRQGGRLSLLFRENLSVRGELELGAAVLSLVETGEGRVIAGLSDGRLVVVDPSFPSVVRQLPAHQGPVRGLAVMGGRLYSVGEDRRLKVWDLSSLIN